MTVTCYDHGSLVYWDGMVWRYSDTNELLEDGVSRPCPRCGRLPTAEGYDACLGHIDGVLSACCGHGVADPIMMLDEPDRCMELVKRALEDTGERYAGDTPQAAVAAAWEDWRKAQKEAQE